MDWTIRVEETRIGLTDDKKHVVVLTHIRNRGSDADWTGTITEVAGPTVYRDTAPDAETLMLRCKEWLAQRAAILERDPYPINERDPIPTDDA